jgi:hypothetical protein
VTFVDVDEDVADAQRICVSARHKAVLVGRRRVLLWTTGVQADRARPALDVKLGVFRHRPDALDLAGLEPLGLPEESVKPVEGPLEVADRDTGEQIDVHIVSSRLADQVRRAISSARPQLDRCATGYGST